MEELLIDHAQFQLTQMEFFIRLAVALGIGFLIGLEREHAALTMDIKSFAGVRTIILSVLLSYLSMMMFYLISPWVLLVSLVGLFGLIGVSYFIAQRNNVGGTNELSVIISFLLGMLTFLGHIEISLAIAMVVVALLSSKIRLHRFIGTISTEEMVAIIRFGVIALLIFPFLPNESIDPYGVVNLREVGLIVLLTSGLSFIGYILMRIFGRNYGTLLTGIVGGVVSSTLITWIFSKKSKEQPSLVKNCMVAIMAATSVMIVRVLVWVIIFNTPLLKDIILPIAVILVASLFCTYYYNKKAEKKEQVDVEEIPLGKPLNLRTAIIFAAFYVGLLLFINFSNEQFEGKGIYLTSAIASATNVSAIVISLAKSAGQSLTFFVASNAIILGMLSNTVIKVGMVLYAGSKELRKMAYFGYGMIFISGIIAFLILNL